MKKFKVKITGYDTMEWGHIEKEMTFEANNEEEAKAKAKQWCKENSSMGGYDYYAGNVSEVE